MKYANFLSKKTVLVLIFVVLMIVFFSVSLIAEEMSYEEYMSVERSLEQTSPCDYNEDWVEEPVLMFTGILDYYREKYDNNQITVGSVYQLRRINGVPQFVCIAAGNYSDCSSDGNYMYLSSGGTVSRWNLTTLESTVIYSGNDPVEKLWGTEEILFFQVGNQIYHYYVPTKTLNLSVETNNLNAWKPMSNCVIYIVEDNPIYWDAVEASGVEEDQKPSNPETFSAWLNQQFGLYTSAESEVMQQCDVKNILMSCGIDSTVYYWYNIVTKQTLSSYAVEESLQLSTSSGLQNSLSPLGAVSPTIWNYPSNTYFSDNKYTGCTCHDGSCSYSNESACDCVIFENAIQCSGYARYVFYMSSGYRTRTSGVTLSSLPTPSSGTSALRSFFTSQNMPILVQTTTIYGGSHSILVYAATDSTISICEANTSRSPYPSGMTNFNCRVLNEQVLTYSQFAGRYVSFNSMIAAPQTHVHTPYYEQYDGKHWLVCSSCFNSLSAKEEHDYGNGFTCVCGATMTEPDNVGTELN